MKKLLLLLLVPAIAVAQKNTKETTSIQKESKVATVKASAPLAANEFSVTGNVTGLADGEVKITTTQGEQVVAKGAAKGGEFFIKGTIDEPGLYWLTMGKEQPLYLFLEHSPITVKGTKAGIKNLQITGSESHNDFVQFRQSFDPVFANLNALTLQLQQAPEEKKLEIMQQYTAAITALSTQVGEFVKAKPASFVSVFLLTVTRQVNDNLAELEQRFSALSPVVKTSSLGKELENYITVAKVGAIGSPAIDFTQNDTNGTPVSLSAFKGKYVLVDFWASWCKPCRLENPNVVNNFNKFKDKNFTVLGVSLDQQKDAWVRAIDADKLAWTHVSDLKFWNNAVAQLYHVQSIPQNFLIDPQGKIVAKDLRGAELEKKLCELLGCAN